MNRFMSMGVVILAILAMAAPVAAAQRPIVLEFQKHWVGAGQYAGTITGGGTIEMTLFDSRVIGNTQHFSANVEVEDSSAGSFTAVVSGQINFSTGRVVLNGTGTSGSLEGARVHEESLLVDPDTGTFEGTLQVMPAS
jgi:hypothetical protein